MKIGLLGEAPNDTQAIQNLLSIKYPEFDFITLLNRINGSMLDNKKAISRLLRLEYEIQKPDIIIFIRDLDSLENDGNAIRKRKKTFSYVKSIVNKNAIFLLNIFEIEALILSDINAFNEHYSCDIAVSTDPMTIAMPKEVLINATKGLYNESHNPRLFALLTFDIVMQNCRYFTIFINKFNKKLANK